MDLTMLAVALGITGAAVVAHLLWSALEERRRKRRRRRKERGEEEQVVRAAPGHPAAGVGVIRLWSRHATA